MIFFAIVGSIIFLFLVAYGAGTQIVGENEPWYVTAGVGAIMITVVVLLVGCLLMTVKWLSSQ